jgi:hypothetical protein
MKPRTTKRASRSVSRSNESAFQLAFAKLLHAHEHSTGTGEPLLTEAGIAYLRQLLVPPRRKGKTTASREKSAKRPEGQDVLPSWDGRRLWLGGILVKEFGQPAPFQSALLDAFQKDRWLVTHIDNPLPRAKIESQADANERLRNVVKNLNKTLLRGTIRFSSDGTRKGVYWRFDG